MKNQKECGIISQFARDLLSISRLPLVQIRVSREKIIYVNSQDEIARILRGMEGTMERQVVL